MFDFDALAACLSTSACLVNQMTSGLIIGMLLFLVASGVTLIFGVLNVIAGYQLSEDFELRLRIGNLLDKDYPVVDGFNTQDRTAQLSLNYQF